MILLLLDIIARNICTISSRNLPRGTKLSALGTLPKKSDPDAYFLAHCQKFQLGAGTYLYYTYKIHTIQTCLINKSFPNFTQRFGRISPPILGTMKNSRTTKTTAQKLNFY